LGLIYHNLFLVGCLETFSPSYGRSSSRFCHNPLGILLDPDQAWSARKSAGSAVRGFALCTGIFMSPALCALESSASCRNPIAHARGLGMYRDYGNLDETALCNVRRPLTVLSGNQIGKQSSTSPFRVFMSCSM